MTVLLEQMLLMLRSGGGGAESDFRLFDMHVQQPCVRLTC